MIFLHKIMLKSLYTFLFSRKKKQIWVLAWVAAEIFDFFFLTVTITITLFNKAKNKNVLLGGALVMGEDSKLRSRDFESQHR